MSTDHDFHRQVLPIHGADGATIGTGTVVGSGLVLTALHVVDPEPVPALRVGDSARVIAVASLPVRHYGPLRDLAETSYWRDRRLIGDDLGTVDIALLAVPEHDRPGLPIRSAPIRPSESVTVAGCRAGRIVLTKGSVLSHDDANFVAGFDLRPGDSGAPAIDEAGRIAGLAVLDLGGGRAIFVGPPLVASAVERLSPLLIRILGRP